MLSIIVSSRNQTLFNNLKINIDATVGCEYELIQIENQKKFGICEAYNRGAEICKYEFMCFIHEDIIFLTNNWGHHLIRISQDESIGLVGIAGSNYRSNIPSVWSSWWSPDKSKSVNILQHNKKKIIHLDENYSEGKLEDVVACDGVFLFTRKSVYDKNKFDSNNFVGFHFYDIDFSLSVFQNYRVCVTHEILIEHYSCGNRNDAWAHEALIFRKKWKNKLPLSTMNINEIDMAKIENKNKIGLSKYVIRFLVKKPFSINMIKLLFECVSIRFFLIALVTLPINGFRRILLGEIRKNSK